MSSNSLNPYEPPRGEFGPDLADPDLADEEQIRRRVLRPGTAGPSCFKLALGLRTCKSRPVRRSPLADPVPFARAVQNHPMKSQNHLAL